MNINIVDVRDVAESHVRALDMGKDGGRYLVTSGSMWMKDVVALLRKAYPNIDGPDIHTVPLAVLAAGVHPLLVSPGQGHILNRTKLGFSTGTE